MRRVRVIPTLLMDRGRLVKPVAFKMSKAEYIGDVVNLAKLFNDMEVDELVLLDGHASRKGVCPDFETITNVAGECFMPLAFGGGVSSIDQIRQVFRCGAEKVIIGSAFFKNPDLVRIAADQFGSQSIVVSIDVKENFWGQLRVFRNGGTKSTGLDPVKAAHHAEIMGAGEILLTAIDRESTMAGFDLDLIQQISKAVTIPVIAHGGSKDLESMHAAVVHGATAVAACSQFIFKGVHRAVLITYPSQEELKQKLFNLL
ncbi:HisA/HisF-related TIM barrel protein [Magnetococcus sp. PR-3]|uniref:HisA/HisF-related TIM barrel protein n=1 Tax=Magnetococcus sp. PR-3 TaxID=3120355 RepID=UPI002FCDFA3A